MLTILYYCLKVIFCSSVLLGYYWLVLRNNRFHQWNRYYLLLLVVVSFVLPLLKVPIPFFATAEETPFLVRGVEIAGLSDLYISRLQQQHQFHITWQLAVTALYVLVALFLGAVLVKNIIKIQRLKEMYPCEFINGIQFYNTQEEGTPFSFFKNIFWNKRIALHSEKGRQILAHELAHIREKHSADKVFLEVLVALAWWNPILYIIRRELALIHEFIADKKASAGDADLQYASLLLMKAMGSEQFALANPFFHSQLKRRLTMLTTSKNPKFGYVRRLMVLPLVAVALILFSFKYKQLHPQDLLKAPEPLTVIIDAGHGGSDDGATGINGAKEDAIALQIALRIKALSEGTNIKVILSRDTDALSGNTMDKEASVKHRVSLSGDNNADFFISLHMNSDNNKATLKASGIEAFVSSNNSLLNKQSRVLASGLLDEISGANMPVATLLKTRKDQSIYILDKNTVPSVLLKIGYITNPADVAFMQQTQNQEAIAKHILNGLAKHGIKAKQAVAINLDKVELNQVPVAGFYKDSGKIKVAAKQVPVRVYKGSQILLFTLTDDSKGYVIKTANKKVYFLTKAEVKKELGQPAIDAITNLTTEFEKATATKQSEKSIVILPSATSRFPGDSTKQPLYVIDGVITDNSIMNDLNPNDIQSVDVLKGESATALYGEKGKDGVIKITTKPGAKIPVAINQTDSKGELEEKYDKTFTNVEQPAEFPGGIEGWRRYLEKNLRYPEKAQEKGTQGAVKVQLTVNEDGSVEDIKALNNPGNGLAEEAERMLKKGPKWKPAEQNGRKVTYRFVQTITFQLQ